ncbi:chemotaxis protein CheD [Sporolactobacillus putidus]|uniref:Probable chemoreceptor glutamine deamidase CheD n=1 Tax=Sporolactobacillus putidus TaxID=492735 RepID=A0A917RXF5_9BACL|nr:chemotaxis protein CheD [Sporolactobacillus putidus]GGL43983.1 chemoreceptor glutamine deamidase CheD [Sporolactobacillus putidus]
MIHVGLSEIKCAESPETLKTMGLGSCVGVILFSEKERSAGMAHVMLPDSSLARSDHFPPGKFANTAVPEMVRLLTREHGLSPGSLRAKIAGGAEMFKSYRPLPMGSIGKRNVAAVKKQLEIFHIPIVAEETGADYGRTIEFFTETCSLMIRAIYKGERII